MRISVIESNGKQQPRSRASRQAAAAVSVDSAAESDDNDTAAEEEEATAIATSTTAATATTLFDDSESLFPVDTLSESIASLSLSKAANAFQLWSAINHTYYKQLQPQDIALLQRPQLQQDTAVIPSARKKAAAVKPVALPLHSKAAATAAAAAALEAADNSDSDDDDYLNFSNSAFNSNINIYNQYTSIDELQQSLQLQQQHNQRTADALHAAAAQERRQRIAQGRQQLTAYVQERKEREATAAAAEHHHRHHKKLKAKSKDAAVLMQQLTRVAAGLSPTSSSSSSSTCHSSILPGSDAQAVYERCVADDYIKLLMHQRKLKKQQKQQQPATAPTPNEGAKTYTGGSNQHNNNNSNNSSNSKISSSNSSSSSSSIGNCNINRYTHCPNMNDVSSSNSRCLLLTALVCCHVCGDDDATDDNAILFCDRCDLAVHQRCYGVAVVPADSFYCDVCTVAVIAAAVSGVLLQGVAAWPVCVVCKLRTGGAMKVTQRYGRVQEAIDAYYRHAAAVAAAAAAAAANDSGHDSDNSNSSSSSSNGNNTHHQYTLANSPALTTSQHLHVHKQHQRGIDWCHLVCCLFTHETYLQHEQSMSLVCGTERISATRNSLRCVVCKQGTGKNGNSNSNNSNSNGACIQCSHFKCMTSYHASCARNANYQLYYGRFIDHPNYLLNNVSNSSSSSSSSNVYDPAADLDDRHISFCIKHRTDKLEPLVTTSSTSTAAAPTAAAAVTAVTVADTETVTAAVTEQDVEPSAHSESIEAATATEAPAVAAAPATTTAATTTITVEQHLPVLVFFDNMIKSSNDYSSPNINNPYFQSRNSDNNSNSNNNSNSSNGINISNNEYAPVRVKITVKRRSKHKQRRHKQQQLLLSKERRQERSTRRTAQQQQRLLRQQRLQWKAQTRAKESVKQLEIKLWQRKVFRLQQHQQQQLEQKQQQQDLELQLQPLTKQQLKQQQQQVLLQQDQQRSQQPQQQQPHQQQPGCCCVCSQGYQTQYATTATNLLLSCFDCHICVHQSCYGVAADSVRTLRGFYRQLSQPLLCRFDDGNRSDDSSDDDSNSSSSSNNSNGGVFRCDVCSHDRRVKQKQLLLQQKQLLQQREQESYDRWQGIVSSASKSNKNGNNNSTHNNVSIITPPDVTLCVLCHCAGGAMKITELPHSSTSKSRTKQHSTTSAANSHSSSSNTAAVSFCHINCALYVPEASFENETTMSPISGTNTAISSRSEHICCLCRNITHSSSEAAAVHCSHPQCYQPFHLGCAQRHNQMQDDDDSNRNSEWKEERAAAVAAAVAAADAADTAAVVVTDTADDAIAVETDTICSDSDEQVQTQQQIVLPQLQASQQPESTISSNRFVLVERFRAATINNSKILPNFLAYCATHGNSAHAYTHVLHHQRQQLQRQQKQQKQLLLRSERVVLSTTVLEAAVEHNKFEVLKSKKQQQLELHQLHLAKSNRRLTATDKSSNNSSNGNSSNSSSVDDSTFLFTIKRTPLKSKLRDVKFMLYDADAHSSSSSDSDSDISGEDIDTNNTDVSDDSSSASRDSSANSSSSSADNSDSDMQNGHKGKNSNNKRKMPVAKGRGKAGKAVALSSSSSDSSDSYGSSSSSDGDSDEDDADANDHTLYCLCKMRYLPGQRMICCDNCNQWYHDWCVAINLNDYGPNDPFECPLCDKTPARQRKLQR